VVSAVVVVTAAVAASAVVDWWAVAKQRRGIELVAKPLTLALLIVVAALARLGDAKPWVVIALVLGLVGDVALMFASGAHTAEGEGPTEADEDSGGELDRAFLVGLGAFLLGHLAYYGAFIAHGVHVGTFLLGVVLVAGASAFAVPRVLRGARAAGGSALANAVGGYAVVLAVMVALAVGTSVLFTAVGGLVFLVSDTTLAWNRFVRPLRNGPLAVIVTYHLAQLWIVAGLIH
jgi:uncharacterized membrane protein YhhN